MAKIRNQDGSYADVAMPILVDVPVVFPCGGGYTLTFPVQPGDEALIVFGNRCIDAWWQSGGVQQQAEIRMHDLSDGFALVGPRSQPRVLPGVSTSAVQLRSDNGLAHIEISGTDINAVSPSAITATAPVVTVNASSEMIFNTPLLKVSGDIVDNYGSNTRTMAGMRTVYNIHTHGNVQNGPSNTSTPSITE